MICIVARWCVVNEKELAKCEALIEATEKYGERDLKTQIGPDEYTYEMMPQLKCVLGTDQYDCMDKIFRDEADLIELGTGLSYTAGEYYNMIPLVAEKYIPGQLHWWRLGVTVASFVLLVRLPYIGPG